MELRTCRGCGIEQPLERYRKHAQSRGGRLWKCNKCENERINKWRQNTARGQRHVQATNLKKYGITPEEYETKLNAQHGQCAICGTTDNIAGKRLAVDHSHITGQVRDLLCHHCNAAIGALEEKTERMYAAIAYVERWAS